MTRKEAADIFRERLDVARTYFDVHGIEDYTQAMELAVEVLSQEPRTDVISRQAAIDEIIDSFKCGDYLQATLRRIEDLPPAQPEPIKIQVDHELTRDEFEKLRKDLADAPIVLLPSAQPEPEPVGCSGCRYERFGNRVCDACSRFYVDRYEAERRNDG